MEEIENKENLAIHEVHHSSSHHVHTGLEDRKEKIKNWIKNPYNLALVGILIIAVVINLYYFSLTHNQPLWYDEAEYISVAKTWLTGVPYEINPQRPLLFPFLALIIFKLGFGEFGLRIFLEIIPALLVVLFTYLLIKEMYNKKIALITSFITSVSWIHIFYTMRIMTDMLGLLFGILSFYCFWKGYVKDKNKFLVWLMGFFIALSFLIRLTGILYGVVIAFFLLCTEGFKFIKKKDLWISLVVFFLTISPYLLYISYYFGDILAFRSGYGDVSANPLGWWMFGLVYDYPELGFFILFLVGLLTFLPKLLSLDLILKKEDKSYYNDFFIVLTIIFTLGFFIYFLRLGENRWLIMMSLGIFVIAAKGIVLISDYLKKISGKKVGAIISILILLMFGAYFQLNHTNLIVKGKISSYGEVKEAAFWMKDNSNPGDKIVSASGPQTFYYSNREVISYFNSKELRYYTPEEFDKVIEKEKPKYLVVSMFEPSVPQWTYEFPQRNQTKYKVVKAWFSDAEQKQPILVVYQVN